MSGEREPTESLLRSFVVVFPSLGFDHRLRLSEAGKEMFVEALIPQAPIEGFDVGVLGRLSRLNPTQRHAALVRPCHHRPSALLQTVVCPQDDRQAGRQAGPRFAARASSTRVIGGPPKARAGGAATASLVASFTIAKQLSTRPSAVRSKDKVGRPDLIWRLPFDQRPPISHRDLLASSAPHLQAVGHVQRARPTCNRRLSQLPLDRVDAVSGVPLRQRDDTSSERDVAIEHRFASQRRGAHTDDGQGAGSLRPRSVMLRTNTRRAGAGYHFLFNASRVTSFPGGNPPAAS